MAGPVQTYRLNGDPEILKDTEKTVDLFDECFKDKEKGGVGGGEGRRKKGTVLDSFRFVSFGFDAVVDSSASASCFVVLLLVIPRGGNRLSHKHSHESAFSLWPSRNF